MNIQEQEDRDFTCDSLFDHCAVQAMIDNAGREDQAWLLTDLDVWVRNPSWNGKGSDRHPEDDYEDLEQDEDGIHYPDAWDDNIPF